MSNTNPLNIEALELTNQVKTTLLTILTDISLCLSYSLPRQWPTHDKPNYVGAWLCRLTYENKVTLVKKIHGRTVRHLEECGIIAKVPELEEKRRSIYVLSDEARKPESIKEMRLILTMDMVKGRKMITWTLLHQMAELLGFKIEYQQARGLLRILTIKGESFRPDEYITQNKHGDPVTKINDLTWEEWINFFVESAAIVDGTKAKKE